MLPATPWRRPAATGTAGPNLDELKPPLDAVIAQVTNGGGGMPPFSGQLTEQQIRDVAAFVVQATSDQGSGGTGGDQTTTGDDRGGGEDDSEGSGGMY